MSPTQEIQAALRKRYCAPEWAYFTEVGDSTGYARRHADGLALNLWPSRGMEVNGFEIKVSLGDFRRELANPAKAEAVQQYCDRWWIVVPERLGDLAAMLPPTWGLLKLQVNGKWHVDVPAPKLEAKPLSKMFIAAVCRRASLEDPGVAALEAARMAGYEEGKKAGEANNSFGIDRLKGEVENLKAREREFERVAGIRFDRWVNSPTAVGAAIKRAMDLAEMERQIDVTLTHVERLHRNAQQLKECATGATP